MTSERTSMQKDYSMDTTNELTNTSGHLYSAGISFDNTNNTNNSLETTHSSVDQHTANYNAQNNSRSKNLFTIGSSIISIIN